MPPSLFFVFEKKLDTLLQAWKILQIDTEKEFKSPFGTNALDR